MDFFHKTKVSVITVTYNVSDSIIPTLESIEKIYNENVEYIIIDGGSTDNTLSIINKYSQCINLIVSEPDRGIYDAMNKGINLANGDWIIFINCGDQLYNIPCQILNTISSEYIAVCGKVKDEKGQIFEPRYDKSLYYGNKLPHQGLFYRKTFLMLFSIKYKVFADYDLNLKMFMNKKKIHLIEDIIAFHSLDGISMNKKYLKELYEVVYENCGIVQCLLLFFHFKFNGLKRRLWKFRL